MNDSNKKISMSPQTVILTEPGFLKDGKRSHASWENECRVHREGIAQLAEYLGLKNVRQEGGDLQIPPMEDMIGAFEQIMMHVDDALDIEPSCNSFTATYTKDPEDDTWEAGASLPYTKEQEFRTVSSEGKTFIEVQAHLVEKLNELEK